MPMGSILIVDDAKNIRETLAMYIRSLGHTVETAADAEMDAAVEFGKASPFPDKSTLTTDVYVGDLAGASAGGPA